MFPGVEGTVRVRGADSVNLDDKKRGPHDRGYLAELKRQFYDDGGTPEGTGRYTSSLRGTKCTRGK